MKHLKNYILISLFLFQGISFLIAGDEKGWTTSSEAAKSFIENKGQFKLASEKSVETSAIKYAYDGGSTMIYFTNKGISYSFLKRWKDKEDEDPREVAKEKAKEQKEILEGKSHAEAEVEEHRMKFKTDVVNMIWEGANPNAQLIAEEPTADYHSYVLRGKNGQDENINHIKAYKKLIYKNLYPNIDVEYVFHPQEGIKYTLILHPGADITNVKMNYSDAVHLTSTGEIHIQTNFGDITDHAPVSFYSGNSSSTVESKFIKNGKTVSFELGAYDHTSSLTIDPWTQTPTLAASNGVWECERDGAGNVYIIGGDSPMKLLKYNTAGALQWTYNTPWDTANYWLGTMATDNAGNTYVTAGSNAKLQKVNAAGTMLFSVSGGGVDEYWTICFNCDQTKLIVGGTRIQGLPSPTGAGMIFDINTATGAVLATKKVGWVRTYSLFGFPVTDIEEVRSMTASFNSRYYYLTLDTLGSIDQNFSACPASSTLMGINDGFAWGYKCENYRPNNGNAGVKGVRANKNFVYTHNGTTVQKRSLTTGAVITSAAIPGGLNVASAGLNQAGNAGIDIDSCGNVYVGSTNAVIKYDANLVLLSSVATSYRVYDIAVSYSGNIIACGATGDNSNTSRTGYVQQINMSSCNPLTLICCNSNFCPVGPFCPTSPSVTLSPDQTGGTWSGPGVNSATGVFSPSIAGPGVHVITYTLACGSTSVSITVNPCVAPVITACQLGGNITVSNGTGTYTWYHSTTTTPCNPGFGSFCGAFTVAGTPVTTWSSFATGTTVNPGTNFPIWVVDGSGDSLQITSLLSLPACSSCPPLTVTPASPVNVSCFGQSTGSFSASTTGGASPYDYTLMNGATTVATFNNIAGSQSFTNLPAGTYTLNVSDNNACPGTVTVTITQPSSALAVSITGSTPATCGAGNGSATALASGGTSPYDYVWTGTSGTLQTTNNITTSNTLSSLVAGTYTITITDNNNCTTSTTVTISSTAGATVSITAQTNVLCFGGTTGSATATAAGGSSPYDYVWTGTSGTLQTTNNIAGADVLNGLAAGTYTVNITDNNGCLSNTSVTITQPSSALAVSITGSTPATCGASNGSATALASGGTSPYDYVWAGTSGTLQTTNNITTSNTLSSLAAGTYTITITDNNSCTASTTVTIGSTAGATVSITAQTNVLCFGGTTGSATATAAGGSSPYDYVWSGTSGTLQTTNNIAGADVLNGLAAGTYTVNVTDNNGCLSSATVTITQPSAALAVSITGSTPASCGASNGDATALASGGTSPYDYVWTGTSGTLQTTNNITVANTLSALAAGTYTVTITDNNNCTASTTVTISNSGGATTTITGQTNILCFGGTTGNATATTTGGASPYDFVWVGSSGTLQTTNNIMGPDIINGLGAGTYTVNVTDNSGCLSSTSVTITQPATALTVSITGTTPASCGASNGDATALATGGTSPYDYVWTGASGTLQTTNNITTADNLSSLAAGTYTVTITDNNSCTASTTVTVTSTGGASVSITAQTNVLCFGDTTGSAIATATGGSSPYDYSWSNASGALQTTMNINGADTLSGLAAGTYSVSVTDNNGCVSLTSVTITEPTSAVSVAITGSTNTACGLSNGDATALASGGSGPYDYVWTGASGTLLTTNNISTSNTITTLAAGSYTVTITDNNGCTTFTTVSISSTGGATVTTTQTDVLCFGGLTGSITATAAGGASPYDYVWTGTAGTLQTTNNIVGSDVLNGLGAGTYTVTVTDNSGCISNTNVTITQPASAASVTITGTTPAGCGMSNGSATAQAAGGTGPYDYVWSNASGTLLTTNNISGPNTLNAVASGTYTITITDNNNCTSSITATITNSGGATTTISSSVNVLCYGGATGSATATTAGGSSPYDYIWTGTTGTVHTDVNITTPSSATGLTAGTYTVSVTDNGGCVSTTTVTISQPASALTASSGSIIHTSCGLNNGSATVTANGGTPGYTYNWSPAGGSGSTASGLTAGTYIVTTTDLNGCTTTATAVINVSSGITASAVTATNVTCFGGTNGSATATGSGGTGTYSYSWTPSGGSAATAIGLAAGTYTVTVVNGTCSTTTTAIITQPSVIVASITTTPAACGSTTGTGTATIGAAGGTGTLSYLWSNGGTGTSISSLNSGSVGVTVTDASGCTQTATGIVGITGALAVDAGVSTTIPLGSNTTLVGTGSADWTYTWSPPGTLECPSCSATTATPIVVTTYTLTVTSGGCTGSDTVTINIDYTCGELFVPTAFSPNGDGNENDVLKVYGKCITNLNFAIFDRWGEKVFETSDPAIGWDGTYKGKKLDTAVFVYYLTATWNGTEVKQHGNITLVK